MKYFIILFVLNVVFAKKKVLRIREVNGVNYTEVVIINGIDRPYQLSYHWRNNASEVLYFSYNCGHHNESTFAVGFAEKGTRVPQPIKGVKNGLATTINVKENLIYYGGSDGIYAQNLSNPNSEVKHIENHDIWDLFYKDHLYFINYPKRRLYKYISVNTSEIQRHIKEKIYQFAIDDDGDTFITNKTGLYMIPNGTHHRIHIKGATKFRAIAVNKKGVTHLCGGNETYIVDKKKHELKEIAKIGYIFGITFDFKDNIIYSDPHQIVKLVAMDGKKKSTG